MSTHSIDSPNSWKTTTHDRPAGLEVVLLKRSYVLPWSQFLFAEGGDNEIRLAFATHDVVIKGSGLGSLLVEFAAQRIARLQQPVRSDRFASGAAPSIHELSVVKIESQLRDNVRKDRGQDVIC
jgi:hypothetical protein